MTKNVTLQICVTCLGDNKQKVGEEFYKEVEKQISGKNVELEAVECFAVCNRQCTVAVSQPSKWTYIIGGLDAKKDIQALFDYIKSYANSPNGRPPISERPEVIQKGTIARLPA